MDIGNRGFRIELTSQQIRDQQNQSLLSESIISEERNKDIDISMVEVNPFKPYSSEKKSKPPAGEKSPMRMSIHFNTDSIKSLEIEGKTQKKKEIMLETEIKIGSIDLNQSNHINHKKMEKFDF